MCVCVLCQCATVVQCQYPGDIQNAILVSDLMSSYDFNTTITYQCNPGYRIAGGSFTQVCEEDGNFFGEELHCEGMQIKATLGIWIYFQ